METVPLVETAIVVLVIYVLTCLIWPYTPCRNCGGRGRFNAPLGTRPFRNCGRCGGSGRRLRFGRRWFGPRP